MKTMCEDELRVSKLNVAVRTLRSERGVSLVVVIMLMVIILAITSAGLFFSSVELRVAGNHRAGTQSFYAADTGVNVGYAQIVLDPAVSTTAFSGTLTGGLTYRSGHINDSEPQTLPPPKKINQPGYSLGVGTGYNQVGMGGFCQYQINVTGLGPLDSKREVEAQVLYGPGCN